MISEDYVSKEVTGNTSWKGPLPSLHLKAILCTFTVAISLSLITNDSIVDFSAFTSSNEDEELIADNQVQASADSASEIEDQPLTQLFGLAPSGTSGKELENYDDTLNEAELADADDQLDKEISDLASKTDKTVEPKTFGSKWITEDVQQGDTISSLFEDLNIPASTLATILENNKSVAGKVHSLRPGDKLSFLVDSKGELIVFIKPISNKEQLRFYQADNSGKFVFIREKLDSYVMDDDALSEAKAIAAAPSQKRVTPEEKDIKSSVVAKREEKVQKTTHETRGRLVVVSIGKGQTFSAAANKAGITYTEINRIIQMFKGKIQFSRHIRAGDEMRVLYTDSKGKGKICAVEFKLAKTGKIASYLNSSDGKFYDEKGLNATKASFTRFPFHSRVRVTSNFNPSRRHPVTGIRRPHNGVDFGLPVGTMIVSPADGIVDKAAFSRSAGYWVSVRHNGGLSTVYMHLSKISVKPGQRVKQGSVLARSGNTGLSTGPHLHYEIRVNGRPVNPLRINLDNRNYRVNNKARMAFAASVKKYKKELHQNNLIAKR